MTQMSNKILITGVFFILTAIILGAFGAHSLKELITSERLASFETGVRYQMYHGLALLAVGISVEKFQFSLTWFYRLIFIGTILFSVSIYFLAMQDVFNVKLSFLGPVTPLGGVILISGWSVILVKLFGSKK